MSFSYDISKSKKDTCSSVCLLTCHKISSIVNLFLSTFLVAYIYTFSGNIHDYIFNVAIYELVTYLTLPIFCFLLSYLVAKSNRVWFYRIGLVARVVLVVFAIFFGKDMANLIALAGFLNGLSYAFYYSSYNTMKHEMVGRKSMNSFVFLDQMTGKIVDIVIPIVLGALIEISTYVQVSIYIFVICLIQIGISFGIKSKRPANSTFSLKKYFSKLKQHPELRRKMNFTYIIGFVYGFTTIVSTLLNICIMMEFGSSFKLGMLTSIFGVVSIISIFVFKRFTKQGHRTTFLMILAVLPLFSTILFAIFPSIATLIIYNLGIAVTKVVYSYLYEVYRYSTLKEEGLYDCITEHQTITEIMFGLSRVFSYSLLFLFNLSDNLISFKVFLCIMSGCVSLIVLFLVFFEIKYFSNIHEDLVEKKNYKIIKKCLVDNF